MMNAMINLIVDQFLTINEFLDELIEKNCTMSLFYWN